MSLGMEQSWANQSYPEECHVAYHILNHDGENDVIASGAKQSPRQTQFARDCFVAQWAPLDDRKGRLNCHCAL